MQNSNVWKNEKKFSTGLNYTIEPIDLMKEKGQLKFIVTFENGMVINKNGRFINQISILVFVRNVNWNSETSIQNTMQSCLIKDEANGMVIKELTELKPFDYYYVNHNEAFSDLFMRPICQILKDQFNIIGTTQYKNLKKNNRNITLELV